ncbi:MAG: helix-turn-helix transcriptional regulator [Terriglobia bacterium]
MPQIPCTGTAPNRCSLRSHPPGSKRRGLARESLSGALFRTVDRTRTPRRPTLTERDKTVIRYLLQGLTNREMAANLEIYEGAVKASLRHVCDKLGVKTRTQLVKVALEQFKDQL